MLVVVEAAVRPELVRRRGPPDRCRVREVSRQLPGRDAERAEVVADHPLIPEARNRLAARPHAVGEVRAKELVGHHAIVAEPVGMRTLERARAWQRVEAAVEAERAMKL